MIIPDRAEFHRRARRGNLIPVYREILADMETPVSAYRKIEKGSTGYLLESVEGGEKIARHSFLGTDASLVVMIRGSTLEVSAVTRGGDRVKRKFESQNPLAELRRILGAVRFVGDETLPRFSGGFVGYIGYDMVRFYEHLPLRGERDLPVPDAAFVFTDTILVFDHVRHSIKVVSNAWTGPRELAALALDRSGPAYPRPGERKVDACYDAACRKVNGIVDRLSRDRPHRVHELAREGGRGTLRSNFTRRGFEAAVKHAKRFIRAGDIIQVVLSQRLETDLAADPFDVYRALRSLNPSPFMYYLKFGDLKIVGSSPEILVRLEEGVVETRPIAGTRPRGANAVEDERLERQLLRDPKERAEHIMLLDLGRNDIGRVSRFRTVAVNEFMAIERYSHVMHIVSDVTGRLARGKDGLDVLAACFPAGTVSGAPKVRAMEIIEDLEPTGRGPYAGAVGYVSFSGNLDTCITIRTIVIIGKKAYVQVGAGIVADSRPSGEYRETLSKAKALIKAIDVAEGRAVERELV